MNKHSLYYHTRLHDWYRQHSIMQDKQSCHHITDVQPSLLEGNGQLTADKLNFINDWCLEVNKTFFAVEKKSSNSTAKHRHLKQSSHSKDFSKSTDLKPFRASNTSSLTNKLNKHVKPLTKHTVLPTTTVVKAHGPIVGLADKRRYKQNSKRSGLCNIRTGKLDLCIMNSTKVKDGEDSGRLGHTFLTSRRSQLKQKQNGNRSSAQFKSSDVSRSLVGNENLYGYYGSISAIVRNVARCNDNSRDVNNVNDETPNPQPISSSEDSYTQDTPLASRRENSVESRKENVRLQQTKKAAFERQKSGLSSFSFLQDGVCTDDNEITVTSVFGLGSTHPGNMKHVRNIDHSKSGRSVVENKQDNAPNQISDKENNPKLSTVLIENESIHSITGVMKDKINYTNTVSTHAKENRRTAIESSLNSGQDMKNVEIQNNTNICEDSNRPIQTSDDESENKNEAGAKESNIKFNATIEDDGKLLECKTTEDKLREGRLREDKLKEGRLREDKLREDTHLTNKTLGLASRCAASNCDEEESCPQSETPTIGHICLSNNLLNMLTIDDCKISKRYSLLKNSESAKEEVKSNRRIQDEVKEITNRATTETRKGRRKLNPHLSQSIRTNSAAKKNNRTTLQNNSLSLHGSRGSTNFERAFQALIHDKPLIQEKGQRKAVGGQKVASAVKTAEGPIYRRLHAALRKQMEELKPNHCAKLLH